MYLESVGQQILQYYFTSTVPTVPEAKGHHFFSSNSIAILSNQQYRYQFASYFCCLLSVLGFKGKDGVPQMVKAYLDKKVMLDEFVTHNMDLVQVNDAIELMKHGKWWVQPAV